MRKLPLSKLQKGLITACALIICISIYLIERPLTKDDLIEQVETAFKQQDSSVLSKVLTSSNQKLQIDETNTKALMSYLQENPEYAQSILTVLQEQSRYYDEQDSVSANDATSTEKIEGFLTLKKEDHLILPDTYSIEIEPVYLTVCTNAEDAVIKINGEKVTETTKESCEKKVGPLLPGEYTVEAATKGQGTKIKKIETVVLWNSDEEITIDLVPEDVGLQTNTDKK